MIALTVSIVSFLRFTFINSIFACYYSIPTRIQAIFSSRFSLVNIYSKSLSLSYIFFSLLAVLALINFSGNVPGFSIPSLYYFYTCSISITLWVSLIVVIFLTQYYQFVAHMLPYGSPAALILFLPLVEIFRQLIRPFTLIVRLSTNLSSGHIMLYMFSFFSVSSLALTFVLLFVLLALLMLELFISLLQAYIFTSLIYLYVSEGLSESD